MSAKERQREIFIEKRARALTMMLLTRREDLRIEEVNEDFGIDYIVRFHSEAKEGLREFGIQLNGVWAAGTKEQADRMLRPCLRRIKQYGPFSLPVCLFLFTMENDEGWYTWVAEPIESENGEPQLRLRDEPDSRQLDNKALTEIMERVDLWYDAVFLRLVVNGPGKSKADRKRAKP